MMEAERRTHGLLKNCLMGVCTRRTSANGSLLEGRFPEDACRNSRWPAKLPYEDFLALEQIVMAKFLSTVKNADLQEFPPPHYDFKDHRITRMTLQLCPS